MTAYDQLVEDIYQAIYKANGSTINTDVRPAIRSALRIVNYFADVRAFHEKFGLPNGSAPRLLDESEQEFRERFLDEELQEFKDAYLSGDLAKAADALVDLTYVTLGTGVMMGLPFDLLWSEVQRANMTKERANSAEDDRSTRKHVLDVVKPAGWQPPRIAEILDQYGRNR